MVDLAGVRDPKADVMNMDEQTFLDRCFADVVNRDENVVTDME